MCCTGQFVDSPLRRGMSNRNRIYAIKMKGRNRLESKMYVKDSINTSRM